MTDGEIYELRGRELDAAVAEHVMGYLRVCNPNDGGEYYALKPPGNLDCMIPSRPNAKKYGDWNRDVPYFSTDLNACALMEKRIEQQSLILCYGYILANSMQGRFAELIPTVGNHHIAGAPTLAYLHATVPAKTRCHSALMAALGTMTP